MNRRAFLCGLTLGALSTPWTAGAQPVGGLPKIGYLSNSAGRDDPDAGFFAGLREHDYEPGRNIMVEERYSAGRPELAPEFAADVVGIGWRVIVAWGPPFVVALTKLTTSTPIVAIASTDPVGHGWAVSLARPGGNITGFRLEAGELNAKRFELLKEAAPKLTSVALLANATRPGIEALVAEAKKAASAPRLKTELFNVSSSEQFEGVFFQIARRQIEGLLVFPDPMFYGDRAEIVRRAEQHRLPAVYWARDYVEAGGLLSYAASLPDVARRAAGYVARILRGQHPGDLPIQEPR